MSDEGLQRLGAAVRTARRQRGLSSMRALAAACGCSARTIGKLERGDGQVADDILELVEDALRWERGRARRILEGRHRPLSDPEFARLRSLWPQLDEQARRLVLAYVEEALGLR